MQDRRLLRLRTDYTFNSLGFSARSLGPKGESYGGASGDSVAEKPYLWKYCETAVRTYVCTSRTPSARCFLSYTTALGSSCGIFLLPSTTSPSSCSFQHHESLIVALSYKRHFEVLLKVEVFREGLTVLGAPSSGDAKATLRLQGPCDRTADYSVPPNQMSRVLIDITRDCSIAHTLQQAAATQAISPVIETCPGGKKTRSEHERPIPRSFPSAKWKRDNQRALKIR